MGGGASMDPPPSNVGRPLQELTWSDYSIPGDCALAFAARRKPDNESERASHHD